MKMRKHVIVVMAVVAVAAFAAAGCKQKEKALQGNVSGQQMQEKGLQPGAGDGANPHEGVKLQEMPASAVHEGKVASTMNSAGYTYVEVDEKGKKLWVAVIETKIKTGDKVEFPDSPPMENFYSKTLNRTFERIIFSPVIRVNGKNQVVPAVPEAAKGTNPHAGMKTKEMP
jgi:hypothetical protein